MMIGILMGILVSQNLFAKAFGGTDNDGASSVMQTANGGYVVAGFTYSFGAGGCDFLVLNLSESGNLNWARTFGGTSYDKAYSIIQTQDGGFAVAGWTKSFGAGNYDFLVLKLSSDGSLEWAKTFGGDSTDYAYSVVQTSDGGFAVAGVTWSFGAGRDDFLVLKMSSDGNLQWAKTFGGADGDVAYSIIETPDGGLVVAGVTSSFGAGIYDFLVVKLASNGSLQWAKTFGGTGWDEGYTIAKTSDDGLVIGGETASFGAGGSDFLILKLTSDGGLEWARTFGGVDYDHAYSITETSDGGLVVAGGMGSFGRSDDFLILKLSSDGNLEAAKTFGGAHSDSAQSVTQTADGGCVVAGTLVRGYANESSCLLMKIDENGDYPGCIEDYVSVVDTPNLMMFSASGNVNCVPGQTSPNLTVNSPILQIDTICATVAASELGHTVIKGISCSPFSGGVLFLSPTATDLRIYSVEGRLVRSLRLEQGQNRITLDRGVYLWQAGAYKGKAVVR